MTDEIKNTEEEKKIKPENMVDDNPKDMAYKASTNGTKPNSELGANEILDANNFLGDL
jgi:hypothetical protein